MSTVNLIKNNKGFSLIELIAVIAIMSVLTGGVAFSVGLAFSKDAEKCATALNDAIYDARMISMTKEGTYELIVSNDSGEFVARTEKIVSGSPNEVINEAYLSENGRIASITAYIDSNAGSEVSVSSSDAGSVVARVEFNKTKGNVVKFNGVDIVDSAGASGYEDGIIEFKIVQSRSGALHPYDMVSLITATGKHKRGEY